MTAVGHTGDRDSCRWPDVQFAPRRDSEGGSCADVGLLQACSQCAGRWCCRCPARADQYDFISALDNVGVSYESIIDMIDIGKALCHDLRSGAAPPVVLGKLQNDGIRACRVGDHPGSRR